MPRRSRRPLLLPSLIAGLVFAALACTAGTPPEPTSDVDDFAEVRATSQAAYVLGVDALQQGSPEAALVFLDQANTFDPDQRAEIQEALQQAAATVRALPQSPTRTPVPSPTPDARLLTQIASPVTTPGVTATPVVAEGSTAWRDPSGSFKVTAPPGWRIKQSPDVEFGTGLVSFTDPTGKAEFALAADPSANAASPELYAAKMDIAMQQVPGYALDNIEPGNIGSAPTLRRNFTLQKRTDNGQTVNTRAFQVAVLRGTTAYILYGEAPATDFPTFESQLNQIVRSFTFL
jgi:hypothetical protein